MAKERSTYFTTEFSKFLKGACKEIFDTSKLETTFNGDAYTIGYSQGEAFIYESNSSQTEYIIPLFKKDDEEKRIIYYVGFTFFFNETLRQSEPNRLSLRFFRGGRLDEINLIFRAEFSKNSKTDHGQPHWHFHFIDEEKNIVDSFEEFDKQKTESFENNEQQMYGIKDIHFYMAWNLKSGYSFPLSGMELLRWVKDTISYIQDQLAYIHKRHVA